MQLEHQLELREGRAPVGCGQGSPLQGAVCQGWVSSCRRGHSVREMGPTPPPVSQQGTTALPPAPPCARGATGLCSSGGAQQPQEFAREALP